MCTQGYRRDLAAASLQEMFTTPQTEQRLKALVDKRNYNVLDATVAEVDAVK